MNARSEFSSVKNYKHKGGQINSPYSPRMDEYTCDVHKENNTGLNASNMPDLEEVLIIYILRKRQKQPYCKRLILDFMISQSLPSKNPSWTPMGEFYTIIIKKTDEGISFGKMAIAHSPSRHLKNQEGLKPVAPVSLS